MSAEPGDTPVLDLVAGFNAAALETSSLEVDEQMIARIAALVAIDAPPASYLMNLAAADASGIDAEEIQGILAAIAPIVGTARVVSAAGKMARALGLALDLAELDEQ
jgi:hypothetical protein